MRLAPSVDIETTRWVTRQLTSTAPVRFDPLPGATSSAVYAVVIGGARTAVLRLFTNTRWLAREADLADHEAAALRLAARAELAAPRLIAVARPGVLRAPAVLMTHLPGTAVIPVEPSPA